ncbi:hypothetical protein BDV24DRAFT_22674 [Aspergillus arachidicola]|uniref:Uncharacterized protein n=1 Tax=Aspergillus arachidicola TaxID=656916 RepID=A0A5N6YHJ7_9EURO|nr:hypothetical protein BDV24DRAFT_22674 [Aspergillus arachidicola]
MPRNPLMDDEGRLGMFYGVLLTKSCSLLWKITLGIEPVSAPIGPYGIPSFLGGFRHGAAASALYGIVSRQFLKK